MNCKTAKSRECDKKKTGMYNAQQGKTSKYKPENINPTKIKQLKTKKYNGCTKTRQGHLIL
ncbi:hypothetical protein [Propionivibrio sp.]|uniref:hypothetical protein n=1 Tax=Propionivibrio sp. TaxID=2212460 RepID=UPI002635A6E4|nr:hypothetical protein [Propionivibrio sp.]